MEAYCRACLLEFEAAELLQYSESKRRLYVYCTGLQVKRNDTFSFQLCKECFIYLKVACKFKKQCRSSDKKFKTYLGLKNAGEIIDFRTYMESIEDTFGLKIPSASRVSTPIYSKNDDDNESTCTSIQNFMTDIRETLQEEDMLTSEDKLIREVIQEEADISDDSLDSHWLEDDNMNDFGMDFNFPAISTPITSNEDRCNTPLRGTTDEEDTCHYVHKDVILKSDKTITIQNKKDREIVRNAEIAKSSNQNDMPLLSDCDMALDGIIDTNVAMTHLDSEFPIANVQKLNNKPVIAQREIAITQVNNAPITFTDELTHYMIKDVAKSTYDNAIEDRNSNGSSILNADSTIITDNIVDRKSICNQSFLLDIDQYINSSKEMLDKNIETEDLNVENELEQYIAKVKSKKKQSDVANTKCSIDKNLELALNTDDNQIFPLEDLLRSPQVSDQHSRGTTPLVNNILFGNITPMHVDKTSQHEMSENNKKTNIAQSSSMNDKNVSEDKEANLINEPVRIFKGSIKSEKNKKNNKKQILNPNRCDKDIARLNELQKFEKDEMCNSSEKTDRTKNIEKKRKIDNEISKDGHPPPKNTKLRDVYDEDKITQKAVTDDLDISITNLLDFDENQSVDLNISIASDFFEVEQKESISDNDIDKIDGDECKMEIDKKVIDEEYVEINNEQDDDLKTDDRVLQQSEDVFKKPLLADENKYNLNQRMCKICNKRFKTVRVLKLHFGKIHQLLLPKIQNKNASRVCEKCGKVLGDSSTYRKHMKMHDGSIKCPYCAVGFTTLATLRRHVKTHTNVPENVKKPEEQPKKPEKEVQKFLCIICDKEFKKSGNFNIHMRRHGGNFSVHCEFCDKGFVRKYDCDQHKITHHTRVFPFCCELCPKKFKDRYMLVGHMYKHMGIKKLTCEHCEMQFDSKQHLKQHFKTCELKPKVTDKNAWEQN